MNPLPLTHRAYQPRSLRGYLPDQIGGYILSLGQLRGAFSVIRSIAVLCSWRNNWIAARGTSVGHSLLGTSSHHILRARRIGTRLSHDVSQTSFAYRALVGEQPNPAGPGHDPRVRWAEHRVPNLPVDVGLLGEISLLSRGWHTFIR